MGWGRFLLRQVLLRKYILFKCNTYWILLVKTKQKRLLSDFIPLNLTMVTAPTFPPYTHFKHLLLISLLQQMRQRMKEYYNYQFFPFSLFMHTNVCICHSKRIINSGYEVEEGTVTGVRRTCFNNRAARR